MSNLVGSERAALVRVARHDVILHAALALREHHDLPWMTAVSMAFRGIMRNLREMVAELAAAGIAMDATAALADYVERAWRESPYRADSWSVHLRPRRMPRAAVFTIRVRWLMEAIGIRNGVLRDFIRWRELHTQPAIVVPVGSMRES